MRYARLALCALVVTLLVGSLAPTVGKATPYGTDPSGPGYFPDSSDHWYCFHPSVPGWDHGRFHSAMSDLDAQTIAYDVYSSTCGDNTDVVAIYENPIYERWDYWGINVCWRWAVWPVCDQFFTKVNPTRIWLDLGGSNGDQNYFSFKLDHVIRHEIGHSVGLGHSSGQHAMSYGMDWIWYYLFYLPHDQCHVNAWLGGPPC